MFRIRFGRIALTAAAMVVVITLSGLQGVPARGLDRRKHQDNIVIVWNEAALQGVRDAKLGPPMVARALAIVHTCMFDAWAAYDKRAVGTRLGGSLRRPPRERTLANKTEAISYGAYRAAVDLFPADAAMFASLMHSLGFDPDDESMDITTPVGIGNVACKAVLDFRHHDGSNQLGDEPGGTPGVPYSDYTGYAPVNDPMDMNAPFDRSKVHDPNRWQPLSYLDQMGNPVTQKFVGPQWNRVIPFALTSDSQFRSSTGPAKFGSEQYVRQARQLLRISANLTDRQKAIAEYWADGPNSELPPGHWDLFAQFVSRRDRHGNEEKGLDEDVKMFFALTNAIFDASICSWDNKRAFDSVRPVTAIRYLFEGQLVRAWGGPYQGPQWIDGADWIPYQPSYFPTPPFAEFSSGHSTFSAAGAEILKLFTGSDRFADSVTIAAGSSKIEPGATPAHDMTLLWPTFTAAANQAGISRRYGGIHFRQGDLDARAGGRLVADQAWAKAQQYFNGSAL